MKIIESPAIKGILLGLFALGLVYAFLLKIFS